jgi:CubicO group peptidase (beta-lactamase class C family)
MVWRAALLPPLLALATGVAADERGRALDALFRDLHADDLFHGAVIIADEGQVLHARGYGLSNREEGTRFTPDTPTDTASMAKTFTAAALWRLMEAGRVRADDRVQHYLPSFPYAEITLAHLLAHSSGLPDYDYFEQQWPPGTPWTNARLLETLAEKRPPLRSPPGTAFSYCNTGYDIAVLVIEAVTGRRIEDYFRTLFVRPLGLTSLFVRPTQFVDWPGERTRGYRAVDGGCEANDAADNEGVVGGANVYLSAHDLHRWNESFWRDPVLAPDALESGLMPAQIGPQRSALSWLSWYTSADWTAHWYAGQHRGFSTRVYREAPSRRSIVFTANNTPPQWLLPALNRAIVALLEGKKPEKLAPPEAAELPPEAREAAQGRYALGTALIELTTRSHQWRVNSAGLDYAAFPMGDGIHYVPGLDAWFWFSPLGKLFWSTVRSLEQGTKQT